MTILQEMVRASIESDHRNLYDLFRAVALFIPDDSELSECANDRMQSMRFSPPENHCLIFLRFREDINDRYAEDEILDGPWWLKVICILFTGGNEDGAELYERLNADFREANRESS